VGLWQFGQCPGEPRTAVRGCCLSVAALSAARAFQPAICPAGTFVSGVFLTTEATEVTEVEWLLGIVFCLTVSRRAADGSPRVWGPLSSSGVPARDLPLKERL